MYRTSSSDLNVGDQREVVRGPASPGQLGSLDFLELRIPANIDGVQSPYGGPGGEGPEMLLGTEESLWSEPFLTQCSPDVVEIPRQDDRSPGVGRGEGMAREEPRKLLFPQRL